MGLLNMQKSFNNLEIYALRRIIGDLSLYQLKNILIYKGIRLNEVSFIPSFINSSSSSTIQDIYLEFDQLYVVVNIFKISAFSCMEALFERYQYHDNDNYITLIMHVAKQLLSIHIAGFNDKSIFQQYYIWAKNQASLINRSVFLIYQKLSEDFNIIVKCKNSDQVSIARPFILGTDRLDHAHLDFQVINDLYLIIIKVLVSSEKNNQNISDYIKHKISPLIDDSRFNIIITFNTIGQVEKAKNNYIGQYSLCEV